MFPTRRQFLASAAAATVATPRLWSMDKPMANDTISRAVNDLSFYMYRHLAAVKPGNVFMSSLSIESALAMVAAGARGETLAEMKKSLFLKGEDAAVHAGFRQLIASLNNEKVPANRRGLELVVANALWGSSSYPWRKEYLALTNENYGAGLHETDFNKPEEARAQINRWVEGQTKNKIRDLLPARSISPGTRMVLTNAIYFKGQWANEFQKRATRDLPFRQADGGKVDVPTMHGYGYYPHAENATMAALEMPYRGGETSMVIVLPKKEDGLSDLEKTASTESVTELWKGLKSTRVDLALPKFKVETEYDLKLPLMEMGMKKVFSQDADLTGMHTSSEKLYIDLVIHKAFCQIDELGTEAAAATAVGIRAGSAPIPTKPIEFKVDRPFLFFIRHLASNTILFAGKIEKL